MYHPDKIRQRIRDEIEAPLNFSPVYRTVAEVDAFEQHLRDSKKYLYDSSGRPLRCVDNLEPWEIQWQLNERALVCCDSLYAVTRYGWVIDEAGVICRFVSRVAQDILFGVIQDLEAQDVSIEIMILKARQLGICLAPSTRVLTAQLEWKPIDEISIGDDLVSVDEHPIQGVKTRKQARRMRTAKVRGKSERVHDTLEILLDTGVRLVATPEHPFLCCRRGGCEPVWRRSRDIEVGDKIRRIVNVWGDGDREDAWLGGLIDGEGCLRDKKGELSVAQVPGAVLDRARNIMQERYAPVREEIDARKGGETSKFGNQPVHKLVVGRSETMFELLGRTRPARFKDRRWWEDKELPGKRIGDQWATVRDIKPLGPQRVVNLDTTTGTFVAEGVVSHNTTLVELLIMLRIVFSSGVNAVVASADREKSLMMAKKLLFAYDHLPVWLRPDSTARVESAQGAKLEFGHLNSGVTVQHGNQMSGIARGATPTIYHLSEVASFSNAVEQIEASLFKAVHSSPNIFGVLESSGEGDQGWWPDTWRSSKSSWDSHTARLYPLFLPWFCGVGMWPEPAWLRKHPVPSGWYERRLPDTREQVAKSELYVRTHDLIRKHLCRPHPQVPSQFSWWTDGSMPLEQQWFWEVEHEEAKRKGLESTFFQEMASDDVEALQRSSESVFGFDTMKSVRDARRPPVGVYGFSGQSIEDIHEPPTEDIDYSLGPDGKDKRVHVRFQNPRGDSYRWELIPLLHDEARVAEWWKENPDVFWDYAHGKLFVWHPPRLGMDYSIGIDTSNGIGEDSTVISVTELAPREGMPDIQAAEFRSAYVSHTESFAFAMCIAAYYASAYAETSVHRQPLVGAEQVASVGDVCQLQMRKMGYSRFPPFIRLDSKKLQPGRSNKLGWYTYSWSRPILMGNFIHSLQNGWYELNSPWTIYECEHFESHVTATGKIKEEHEEGEHDDGIFAAAISIQIARGLQSMTERSKHRFMGNPGASQLPPLDTSRYRGEVINSSEDLQKRVVSASELML